jgi:hypothetical protein
MAGGLAGGIAIRRYPVESVASSSRLEAALPGRYGLTAVCANRMQSLPMPRLIDQYGPRVELPLKFEFADLVTFIAVGRIGL